MKAKLLLLPSYIVAKIAPYIANEDVWLVYKDRVLDVTKWVSSHPGGEQMILRFAGMDGTDDLRASHDDHVLEAKLPWFVVGMVATVLCILVILLALLYGTEGSTTGHSAPVVLMGAL
ncbi:hypothetical protein ACHAWF_005318 [Thalassiosira exigua]